MKKSLKMLTMLNFLSVALFFTACLDGDDGGSKGGTRPMDERLIGWWECEDVTGGTGDNPGVFNIERNKITMMMLGNDDGEGADGDPEDKIDAGQLYGGNILSISSTADKNDDGEDLHWHLDSADTHKYVTAGDEYRPVDGALILKPRIRQLVFHQRRRRRGALRVYRCHAGNSKQHGRRHF